MRNEQGVITLTQRPIGSLRPVSVYKLEVICYDTGVMELSRSERISIRLTVFTQYQQVTDRETDGPTDEIVIHELMQTLRRTIKTSRATVHSAPR